MSSLKCRECGGVMEYCAPGITTNKNYYRCINCGYIDSRNIAKAKPYTAGFRKGEVKQVDET